MKEEKFLKKTRGVVRDFIFGMEDGLVSTLGLVLGVYTGGGSSFAIVLAGLASMFVGAFSMSAGSYLSAKSQREVYQQEIRATKEQLRRHPRKCEREMKKILRDEYFDQNEIRMLMRHFTEHRHSTFVKNYIQKKTGLSIGRFDRPLKDALTMFLSFLGGSVFPIAPFSFLSVGTAATAAALLTIAALFTVGWAKTVYTKRNWLKSGMEIVLVGLGAGIIGYLVGWVLSGAG